MEREDPSYPDLDWHQHKAVGLTYHPNARTHTVETVIYRLRKKLETGIIQYQLLQTINGGYRLNALSTADER